MVKELRSTLSILMDSKNLTRLLRRRWKKIWSQIRFFFNHLIYSFTTNSCYLNSSAEAQHDSPDYAGLVFSFLPFAANFSEFFCYFYIWPYFWSSLFWTIDRPLGAKFLTKAIVLNLLHLEAADEHNCHFYYPTNLYYYVYWRYPGISPENIKFA